MNKITLKSGEVLSMDRLQEAIMYRLSESPIEKWPDTMVIHPDTLDRFLMNIYLLRNQVIEPVEKMSIQVMNAKLMIYRTYDLDVNTVIVR